MSTDSPLQKSQLVVYIQYTNPTSLPPLESSSKIFASHGWKITFLGVRAQGNADRFKFVSNSNVSTHLMKRWGSGWSLKLHYLCFIAWTWLRVVTKRPDIVWISDVLACPVGAILSSTTSIPIVYQEHDGPSTVGTGSKVERMLSRAREFVASRASLCILPNESRAQAFRSAMPVASRTQSVMNCPSLTDVSQISLEPKTANRLRIYYHGSLVPVRLPLTVLDALALLPPTVGLSITGFETVGSPGYMDLFLKEALARGLQSRVRYEGPLASRDLLLSRCAKNDVGLALLPLDSNDPNERMMAGATNKIFDYLACGMPVLVPDLPDHRRLFVENGVALACDPSKPESIASALAWLLNHPVESREMGRRGRTRILADWNYEFQFKPVLDLIAS